MLRKSPNRGMGSHFRKATTPAVMYVDWSSRVTWSLPCAKQDLFHYPPLNDLSYVLRYLVGCLSPQTPQLPLSCTDPPTFPRVAVS